MYHDQLAYLQQQQHLRSITCGASPTLSNQATGISFLQQSSLPPQSIYNDPSRFEPKRRGRKPRYMVDPLGKPPQLSYYHAIKQSINNP